MPRLSKIQRNQAMGMLNAGAAVNHVAREILQNLVTRCAATGSVCDRQRQCREHTSTSRDERAVTLIVLCRYNADK